MSNMHNKSDQSLHSFPDMRSSALEKENADLKCQIIQLKKSNEWFMSRIAEQGNLIKNSSLADNVNKSHGSLKA